MRRYAIQPAHNRADVMRRMMRARAGKFSGIFGGGLGDATRLDAELQLGIGEGRRNPERGKRRADGTHEKRFRAAQAAADDGADA